MMPILGSVSRDASQLSSAHMHMSYASQAASYRDLEVLSASPDRLLLMLFDGLLVQLERARLGTERNNLEMQVTGLTKSRAILGELLATLDFEQGGEIATQLADLYQFMLVELVDVGQRRDVAMMRRLSALVTNLRDGFAGAVEQVNTVRMSA
jgi:flagellar protein FliS